VSSKKSSANRPEFPKRAIVTAGMPYGNKGLHFGHIGGVFIPADVYARFLRDRIGSANVLFVSGTDCYGSPIDEGFRKLREDNAFDGNIRDYVQSNHDAQFSTLESYDISLDIFEGSGLAKSKAVHERFTGKLIRSLYDNGHLCKSGSAQFYDETAQTFLNGRQVLGRCPVQGCKSSKAYADECDLGHQYLPEDLINPISAISGEKPVMREVSNWYFDLPSFTTLLKQHVDNLKRKETTRAVVVNTIEEFLVPPIIYVKTEHYQQYLQIADKMPEHSYREAEKGKASFELEFNSLEDRDRARDLLNELTVRMRTGKTLVPFRITGNIEWGVPAPALDDDEKRTVWCWPESLWAPISFTSTYLENDGDVRTLNPTRPAACPELSWEDFWCSQESTIYQFIGQDNIYFYGVAQTALWAALASGHEPSAEAQDGELQQSTLVANYHLLFLDKKASSSGDIKPPMADELLDHYTVEQLRAHFFALGLGMKPVSFQPKPLNPTANESAPDPVLKESALLTNILNRLARSCFYEAQSNNAGYLPLVNIDEAIIEDAEETILEYERLMHRLEFHAVMSLLDSFIRRANKYWADAIRAAGEDPIQRAVVLANSFHLLRVALLLMHPIAPMGVLKAFSYLNLEVDEASFFNWDSAFEGFLAFVDDKEKEQGGHLLKVLPPRTDFFEKHPSQFT